MNMAPITVTINSQGRIVIPADVRERLGFRAGDKLLIEVRDDDGRLQLSSPRSERRRVQRDFEHLRPTGEALASDELIAERRIEAILEHFDDFAERRRIRRALLS